MTDDEARVIRETLATCADGIGQLLSAVQGLVVAVGVRAPDEPSLSMQLRDIRERLGRVESVAAGARDAADRTHALLLNESDELGAADKSMQEQIDEIGGRLDGIVHRQANAGAKP